MKETKDCFYSRFVNEENLKNISNILIQKQFRLCGFLMSLFCLISIIIPSFTGFNFANFFSTLLFCLSMCMYASLLCFCILFIHLSWKYNIFKKKWYPLFFTSIYILLSLMMTFIVVFTYKYEYYGENSYSCFFNPAYFFFLFLPLFFGYSIFCYYAFMKCFRKYWKLPKNIINP